MPVISPLQRPQCKGPSELEVELGGGAIIETEVPRILRPRGPERLGAPGRPAGAFGEDGAGCASPPVCVFLELVLVEVNVLVVVLAPPEGAELGARACGAGELLGLV